MKHHIRNVELNIVNVAIKYPIKTILKIIIFFFIKIWETKDIIKVNKGSIMSVNSKG